MAIKIFNSLTQKYEEEFVCAEGFMKFLYENPCGKFLLWTLVKRKFFSKIFGFWADSKISKKSADEFIKNHKMNADEFLLPPDSYKCFNDFFTRELKAGARPLPEEKNALITPSDGRHLAIQNISACDSFYAKNQRFNLEKFLNSKELAQTFEGGAMLISRLSPLDYHRYHFPFSGRIISRKDINGALFSVSPIALRKHLEYFFENKRTLTLAELQNGKTCAITEIGATNVGSIIQLKNVGDTFTQGECKGYFKFGGSCLITIFPKDTVRFNDDILNLSKNNIEFYALANQKIGEFI